MPEYSTSEHSLVLYRGRSTTLYLSLKKESLTRHGRPLGRAAVAGRLARRCSLGLLAAALATRPRRVHDPSAPPPASCLFPALLSPCLSVPALLPSCPSSPPAIADCTDATATICSSCSSPSRRHRPPPSPPLSSSSSSSSSSFSSSSSLSSSASSEKGARPPICDCVLGCFCVPFFRFFRFFRLLSCPGSSRLLTAGAGAVGLLQGGLAAGGEPLGEPRKTLPLYYGSSCRLSLRHCLLLRFLLSSVSKTLPLTTLPLSSISCFRSLVPAAH